MDLPVLEELIVVVRRGVEKGENEQGGWTVSDVEERLREAKRVFLVFWRGFGGDEGEGGLEDWCAPKVRMVTGEELRGMCWV